MLKDILGIIAATVVFATAIFHPLCVIAFCSVAAVYHLGQIREAIVSHSVFGVFAIRRGPWKLILENRDSGGWVDPRGTGPQPGAPGQLYNLEDDPGERNNLFDAHPGLVAELTDLLESYKTQGRSVPIA